MGFQEARFPHYAKLAHGGENRNNRVEIFFLEQSPDHLCLYVCDFCRLWKLYFLSIKIYIKYNLTEKTNDKSAVAVIGEYLQQFLWVLVVKLFFKCTLRTQCWASGGSVMCLSLDDGHHGLTSRSRRWKIPLLILSLYWWVIAAKDQRSPAYVPGFGNSPKCWSERLLFSWGHSVHSFWRGSSEHSLLKNSAL